jgi:hypothetical protein
VHPATEDSAFGRRSPAHDRPRRSCQRPAPYQHVRPRSSARPLRRPRSLPSLSHLRLRDRNVDEADADAGYERSDGSQYAGQRMEIRPLLATDASAIHRSLLGDPEVSSWFRSRGPFTLAECEEMVTRKVAHRAVHRFGWSLGWEGDTCVG